jgi:hypothetical protein
MRNSIRSYACALALIAALAVPISAAPTTSDDSGDFLTKLKNLIIVIYDEAKIILPTG